MLSKCANPECSEIFLHLREGKIFYLAPTPEVQIALGTLYPTLQERFWLCARCSKEMTLIWTGTQVQTVPLPEKVVGIPPVPAAKKEIGGRRRRARAASAGREDR